VSSGQRWKRSNAARRRREAERKKLETFTAEFLGSHVNDDELAMIRRLVANAVKDGSSRRSSTPSLRTSARIGVAPSTTASRNWPDTLKGKARELFDRFQANAKPKGFKLKAMIVNFPGGMPGDVGFFINWAPDRK
jgi:hypothetical protein